MWLINNIPLFRWLFVQVMKRKTKNKKKVKEVVNEYQELIEEYGRIQRKESKLPFAKRQYVVNRVIHLVNKGHIKVNN